MGWTDPIFAPDGLVAGVAPTGLWMGLNQFASIEDQEAMLAAGAVPAEYFDMSVTTGKDNIHDIHTIHSMYLCSTDSSFPSSIRAARATSLYGNTACMHGMTLHPDY